MNWTTEKTTIGAIENLVQNDPQNPQPNFSLLSSVPEKIIQETNIKNKTYSAALFAEIGTDFSSSFKTIGTNQNFPIVPNSIVIGRSMSHVAIEDSTSKIGIFQVSSTNRSTGQIRPPQISPTQISPTQVSPTQVSPTQISPTQVSSQQVDSSQISTTQIDSSQISSTQVHSSHISGTEIEVNISPAQVNSSQVNPTQVDTHIKLSDLDPSKIAFTSSISSE